MNDESREKVAVNVLREDSVFRIWESVSNSQEVFSLCDEVPEQDSPAPRDLRAMRHRSRASRAELQFTRCWKNA